MAFTEKVSLSGTALSFLLYECIQYQDSQEGFLLGDVTSEVTSHISDSQSDRSRLDTEIVVRSVLPLPGVAQIYTATGRLRDERLAELPANAAAQVIGWYKYRRGNSLKPTLRDKLVTRGLQRYFERSHNKRHFVLCNVTSKESVSASTHTLAYRFGKINCLDAYEYVEDVTPNLGEKLTGYRKPHRRSPRGVHVPDSVWSTIVRENNAGDSSSDAVQRIQIAVDARLLKEAQTAVLTEKVIRELEAEIRQMTTILSERHCADMDAAAEERHKIELAAREKEMADICAAALAAPAECDLSRFSQYLTDAASDSDDVEIVERKEIQRAPSPVIQSKVKNYAAALRNSAGNTKSESAVSSSSKSNTLPDDLIDLDVDVDKQQHPQAVAVNDRGRGRESSPDY